jgi:hypothetical protein
VPMTCSAGVIVFGLSVSYHRVAEGTPSAPSVICLRTAWCAAIDHVPTSCTIKAWQGVGGRPEAGESIGYLKTGIRPATDRLLLTTYIN